jgi:hypothetical protein
MYFCRSKALLDLFVTLFCHFLEVNPLSKVTSVGNSFEKGVVSVSFLYLRVLSNHNWMIPRAVCGTSDTFCGNIPLVGLQHHLFILYDNPLHWVSGEVRPHPAPQFRRFYAFLWQPVVVNPFKVYPDSVVIMLLACSVQHVDPLMYIYVSSAMVQIYGIFHDKLAYHSIRNYITDCCDTELPHAIIAARSYPLLPWACPTALEQVLLHSLKSILGNWSNYTCYYVPEVFYGIRVFSYTFVIRLSQRQ